MKCILAERNIYAKPTHQLAPGIVAVVINDPSQSGISAVRIDMEAHSEFPEHVHPEGHLIQVLGGNGELEAEDGLSMLHPNVVSGVAGLIRHTLRAGSLGMQVLSFNTPPKQLDDPTRLVYEDAELRANGLYTARPLEI
jgi:hypothetical protein